MAAEDRLEILSTSLLDQHRSVVKELKHIAQLVHLEFGWHYLLDLAWIIHNLDLTQLNNVLDAGAGVGVMQWYLASKGINVLSVDREDRSELELKFRKYFFVQGFTPQDLDAYDPWRGAFRRPGTFTQKLKGFGRDQLSMLQKKSILPGSGTVTIYQQDLKTLTDVPENSFDAIVAVSSLEHNSPEDLPLVVDELMRVLKPGGKLVASLSTVGAEDNFHAPSSGWMYSEASMKKCFKLDENLVTNFDEFPRLLEQIRNSTELREGLAKFYFYSDKGGMPRGIWDPQYVPIGVCKVKA